jgi:hypothetical protein
MLKVNHASAVPSALLAQGLPRWAPPFPQPFPSHLFLFVCLCFLHIVSPPSHRCPFSSKIHTQQRQPPPLRSQQRVPKPSIFPSDSDSQHSFTYLCELPVSSKLISLIFIVKSEFSCVLAYPTTRNATKTSPTQRSMPQTGRECIQSPYGPSS